MPAAPYGRYFLCRCSFSGTALLLVCVADGILLSLPQQPRCQDHSVFRFGIEEVDTTECAVVLLVYTLVLEIAFYAVLKIFHTGRRS